MKDLLTLVIPLAGMLLTTYLMLQHFHNKSIEQNDSKIKSDKNNKFFPLQIQAYERIILFLERIFTIFPFLGFSFCCKKSGNLTLPIKQRP